MLKRAVKIVHVYAISSNMGRYSTLSMNRNMKHFTNNTFAWQKTLLSFLICPLFLLVRKT